MSRDQHGLRVLTPDECLERLGDGGIGRVAVSLGALPAIFPVNFTLLDGQVVFTTTPGTKLSAAAHNAVVAFEVDRIDAKYQEGWSVMVVGRSEQITDPAQLARARQLPLTRWARGEGLESFVLVRSELVSGVELGSIRVPPVTPSAAGSSAR